MIHKAGSAGQGLMGFLTSFFGFMLYPITLVFSILQRVIAPALPAPRRSDTATTAAATTERSGGQSESGRGNVLGGRKREPASADKSVPSTSKATGGNESVNAKKPKQSDQ